VFHAGIDSSNLPNGTRVKFHFVTKLISDSSEVLDDSRTWEKAMELILGKKFKLEAWETCLQTMAVGEVASFKVFRGLPGLLRFVFKAQKATLWLRIEKIPPAPRGNFFKSCFRPELIFEIDINVRVVC
jgi:AH receptor-interacting protein